MSSIAYVTDQQMIEFHRINGNDGMNFWRPSVGKRFSDFKEGDLLFFLAKGSNNHISKEKGIIGYGRFTHAESLSARQMWSRYENLNGYPTEELLKQAILRVSKSSTLPPKISCLHLKDVVFFQSPLYLSDLGLKISKNVESFIYLDKDDPEMTTKILLKANEIGIDFWTSAVSKSNPSTTVFDDDLNWHLLRKIEMDLPSLYRLEDQRKAYRLLSKYKNDHQALHWLSSLKQALIEFEQNTITITLAFVSNKSDLAKTLVYQKGLEQFYFEEAKRWPKLSDIHLKIRHISEWDLKKELNFNFDMNVIQILKG
jgi:hypothetical protein